MTLVALIFRARLDKLCSKRSVDTSKTLNFKGTAVQSLLRPPKQVEQPEQFLSHQLLGIMYLSAFNRCTR